jgi:hypothetical protein
LLSEVGLGEGVDEVERLGLPREVPRERHPRGPDLGHAPKRLAVTLDILVGRFSSVLHATDRRDKAEEHATRITPVGVSFP